MNSLEKNRDRLLAEGYSAREINRAAAELRKHPDWTYVCSQGARLDRQGRVRLGRGKIRVCPPGELLRPGCPETGTGSGGR